MVLLLVLVFCSVCRSGFDGVCGGAGNWHNNGERGGERGEGRSAGGAFPSLCVCVFVCVCTCCPCVRVENDRSMDGERERGGPGEAQHQHFLLALLPQQCTASPCRAAAWRPPGLGGPPPASSHSVLTSCLHHDGQTTWVYPLYPSKTQYCPPL